MTQTAIVRDQADYGAAKPAHSDYLRYAARQSGRGMFDLVKDICRLQFGRGRLPLHEYVAYGVYDTARHSLEDQTRFITNALTWPLSNLACDTDWQGTVEDKWLTARMLEGSGVRVPETLAVIDRGARTYPGTRKISSGEDLRDFVLSRKGEPVFGKENRGICSFGAFLIEGGDESEIRLKNDGAFAYETMLDQLIGETAYILQPVQQNHAFFERYTTTLATVRACVLLTDEGLKLPFCVLKLPSSENLADNFWRKGNLACNLDPATGEILTAKSKLPIGTCDHDTHPDTGEKLIGEHLPMWSELLDMVETCARVFEPLRYQAMDIAITPEGPVLIENNTGGGFDLPQFASGQGFLTDEVIAFFKSCGYEKL